MKWLLITVFKYFIKINRYKIIDCSNKRWKINNILHSYIIFFVQKKLKLYINLRRIKRFSNIRFEQNKLRFLYYIFTIPLRRKVTYNTTGIHFNYSIPFNFNGCTSMIKIAKLRFIPWMKSLCSHVKIR